MDAFRAVYALTSAFVAASHTFLVVERLAMISVMSSFRVSGLSPYVTAEITLL